MGFGDSHDLIVRRWELARRFTLVGPIEAIETIAVGTSIRDIQRLRRSYGCGRWRKLKGLALVRFTSGRLAKAEVHWYEAHGIGRKELRIKRIVE